MKPKKSPSKSPNRSGKYGGRLLTGNPGNKGGTGRPPDKFKELCRELACSGAEVAPKILKDVDHPAYLGALKWASEHGYGKPKETLAVEVSLKLTEKMAKARARLADG